MSTKEMTTKIHQLRKLNAKAEALAAEIETIKDEIKAEMTAQSVDELNGSDWKVTWKPVTSFRFDSAAFKKALPDVAEVFTRETTTRRFCIV